MSARFEPDLPTRLLRMLVPASLAGGIVALYPAIAEQVVSKLGPGFRPGLVAVYVATLVVLFLIDATLRDRRLARLGKLAEAAERRAEAEAERSRELLLMLDLSSALDASERVESALLSALDRLRTDVPFECASVFAPDPGTGNLVRRGICPLTSVPSVAAEAAARAAFTSDDVSPTIDQAERTRTLALPLIAQGERLAVLVLEGIEDPTENFRKRILAVGDRLATALATRRLVSDLDAKERALRQAWQEMRHSGRRLARSGAQVESAAVADAASRAILGPACEARQELRRIRRALIARDIDEPQLGRVDEQLAKIEAAGSDLRLRGEWAEPVKPVDLNDLVVAAVDLISPELKRSKVEVRMRLDHTLGPISTAESALYHVLVRLLRRLRAELRRTPTPRRIEISTRAVGAGGRLELRANSAGLGAPAGPAKVTGSNSSNPAKRAVESDLEHATGARPTAWRLLVRAARIRIRPHRAIGEGFGFTVMIPGVKEARLL